MKILHYWTTLYATLVYFMKRDDSSNVTNEAALKARIFRELSTGSFYLFLNLADLGFCHSKGRIQSRQQSRGGNIRVFPHSSRLSGEKFYRELSGPANNRFSPLGWSFRPIKDKIAARFRLSGVLPPSPGWNQGNLEIFILTFYYEMYTPSLVGREKRNIMEEGIID